MLRGRHIAVPEVNPRRWYAGAHMVGGGGQLLASPRALGEAIVWIQMVCETLKMTRHF